MKHIELAYKNGTIKDFFENEVDDRVSAEYPPKVEKGIVQNMLTDTDPAITYLNRVKEIKTAVKAEICSVLGFDVDVGFNPDVTTNGIYDQIGELSEALNMILEGVTE